MPELLSSEEARVLGCLLEKEAATPEYYPLTLNALRNACNQSSSRNPVVSYDDSEVSRALATLREKGLIRVVYSPSNRAVKYRQVTDEAYGLDDRGRAVMCLLLLRGPQTVGELRIRSDRLCSFESLEEVERVLDGLADRDEPLVARLPRAPGQKEARFAQLLTPADPSVGGPGYAPEPAAPEPAAPEPAAPEPAAPEPDVAGEPGAVATRVAGLEAEMAGLRSEVGQLRATVESLRALLD
ncbi:MAG: YceH family protein [Acidimicrobiales bacterium]